MHERLLREGKIHGVEIFNGKEHYPRVLQWYEEMGFSMLANSDIHYPSGPQYPRSPSSHDARFCPRMHDGVRS